MSKTAEPTLPPITENIVLDLLRERHSKHGNGGTGEYAFLTHVRNKAGFDAQVTVDAVAMSLWPSRGLTIDVFEVKVSRSDWLREIGKPAKAEAACKMGDRFWVVAPRGVVEDGELPPTWGLMEVHGRKLRVVKHAPLLHGDPNTRARNVTRDLLVGFLRATEGAVPKPEPAPITLAEIQGAYDRGYEEGIKHRDQWRKRALEAEEALHRFERITGISVTGSGRTDAERITRVAQAVRAVLDKDEVVAESENAIRAARSRLVDAADHLGMYLPKPADGQESEHAAA